MGDVLSDTLEVSDYLRPLSGDELVPEDVVTYFLIYLISHLGSLTRWSTLTPASSWIQGSSLQVKV